MRMGSVISVTCLLVDLLQGSNLLILAFGVVAIKSELPSVLHDCYEITNDPHSLCGLCLCNVSTCMDIQNCIMLTTFVVA